MKLKKYKQDKKFDGYTSHDILKRVRSDLDWTYLMKTQFKSDKLSLSISTQVSGWWVFRKRWLLVLDCDSEADKAKALNELDASKIKYKVFRSTLSRYWIITNYIGKFWDCIRLMETIPGVDGEFISFCKEYRKIFLRAYPKNGYRPNLILEDSFSGRAKRWYELFKYYWHTSHDVDWIIKKQQEKISKKIELEIAEKLAEEKREALHQEELEREKNKRKRFFRGEANG